MALQANKTWNGVTVQNTYIKVLSYSGDKHTVSFSVGYFASPDEQKMFGQEQRECSLNLNGENPIKQAYEHLKTLPEFSGATDV
jgi:hypothetical protein